ncbi:hypothetical protein [Schumannella soli]|uniref:Uncharacterized protein n=1 Tax=Schumannella soli TaxID=2590779 RepID=A0A506Y6D1_9MICO|nr:hypothetical protein [Schumannella soli]TPW77582.1 hypothetical protein FJ657_02600 [Schumannella soli]
MAEGTEIIAIDPDVLHKVAKDLTAVGDQVGEVDARITQNPISASAFGVMNAWMAPPISALIAHTADVVKVTGELATAVGAATTASADDFERNEQAIVSGVSKLEQDLDHASGRSILR